MKKRKQDWKDEAIAWETGTGEFDRQGTIENRHYRQESLEPKFVAPGAEQKWRARDLLDIHWNLANIECPESFNRVLSCIVGHANPDTGTCYPRQDIIAIETGYSRDTVKRAVAWWKKKGFLVTESRGLGKALAYHPQWALLESFWVGVATDIAEQKASRCIMGAPHEVHQGAPHVVHQGAPREVQYAAPHNLKVEPQTITPKNEPHPERVRPPSVADTHVISSSEGKKEEGIQGEQVVGLPPSPQPPSPAEPLLRERANKAVFDCMTPFDWDNCTEEAFEAAIVAEMAKPGSGRAIVVASSSEAWRAKRKGDGQ